MVTCCKAYWLKNHSSFLSTRWPGLVPLPYQLPALQTFTLQTRFCQVSGRYQRLPQFFLPLTCPPLGCEKPPDSSHHLTSNTPNLKKIWQRRKLSLADGRQQIQLCPLRVMTQSHWPIHSKYSTEHNGITALSLPHSLVRSVYILSHFTDEKLKHREVLQWTQVTKSVRSGTSNKPRQCGF